MHAALLSLALVAAPASNAKLDALLKKFPEVTLPYAPKDCAGAAITAEEAQKFLGLQPPGDDGATAELKACARFKGPGGSVGLVLRDKTDQMMASSDTTDLFVLDKAGKKLGVVTLGGTESSEAGKSTFTATVGKDFEITVRAVTEYPEHEAAIPNVELVPSTTETVWMLGANGAPTKQSSRAVGFAGKFVDKKSGEKLWVGGDTQAAVYAYQGKKKPVVLKVLALDAAKHQATVAFPDAPKKPYVLTWSDDGARVNCLNPDKTQQTFAREW